MSEILNRPLKTDDFDYFLPESQIAQTPAEPRDSSKLLCYNRETGEVSHKIFSNVIDLLKKGDVLVINTTKVYPARMFAHTEFGGKVEILLLKRLSLNNWEVMVKPGKKARIGTKLTISKELSLVVKDRTETGERIVEFIYEGVFEDIISRLGEMPLPPYIKQKLENQERYQTVYAKNQGSSAAPTAGLHFTTELLQKIKEKGVEICEVELNVGLGTFRPVKVDDVTKHEMHTESFFVPEETAKIVNKAKAENRRVIAVGTTSVRTLESAVNQSGQLQPMRGDTNIFIYPPYKFKIIDGLITNFHLPKSTLIMLVSAFIGRDKTLQLYNLAVNSNYRFFSFGDACLFL